MSQNLQLETGDVSVERAALWTLTMTYDLTAKQGSICLDSACGSVTRDEWPQLIAQVDSRDLARWQFSDYPPPLGASLKNVVKAIKSTASFQLFLAGFQIADSLGLVKHDWNVLLQLAPVLSDIFVFTSPRRGRLYVAPEEWFEQQETSVIEELLKRNKIGRLTAESENGNRFQNVYIPYATPITLPTELSESARAAWDELRALYKKAEGGA